MQGWLWQLRQPDVPAERQRQGFDTLERNIALQCRLVEDLLDASGAVAGRLTLESRWSTCRASSASSPTCHRRKPSSAA